ncbi:MAG: sensor domain CHASE-containing protein [Gammaproteobacteria bacterium]|jgi:sensor domain CHASE-containing protein
MQELSAISSKLQGVITNNLALISGLAAHISINPKTDQEGFERYASAVLREESLITNMAAAPNLIVTMGYSSEANKGVIGLDYSKKSEQFYAAKLTRNRRGIVVAGRCSWCRVGLQLSEELQSMMTKGIFRELCLPRSTNNYSITKWSARSKYRN